jgi:hypothetical protein
MVSMLGLSAIVVDLSQQRSSRRSAQSIADLAALGGGKSLSAGDPTQACIDAITYLNINVKDLSPKINAAGFCTQPPNHVAFTNCNVTGGGVQAKPTTTVGRYTVTLMYPVLDSDMADANFTGNGKRDGTACQRMGVKVGINDNTYFGRIFGASSLNTSRTAVVKMSNSRGSRIPALWLLDPYGCTSLAISGGSQLTLGDTSVSPPIPGVATIDSDGTGCSQNQVALSSTGTATFIKAVPTTAGPNQGVISIYALPVDATTCVNKACDQDDVNGGRVQPQPVPAMERATRAPIDWRYNCKQDSSILTSPYPNYHGIRIDDCPIDMAPTHFVDTFTELVGTSGQPVSTSFVRWTDTKSCNVPTGSTVITGNVWVDCTQLAIGAGSDLVFNGNVVFDGTVKMTGGSIRFNANNASSQLPDACRAAITVTCLSSSSQKAAWAYFRNGDLNITGGAIRLDNTLVFQKGGAIKDTGGVAPVWSPPAEGPFKSLSLWSEASDQFTVAGGGGLDLKGVFFTPEANPFKITGGGGVNQQHAQFVSYHLDISGSGELKLAPDLEEYVAIPPKAGTLIR